MAEMVEMDQAAKLAEEELINFKDEDVALIASWFAKNYLKAGHKRLGRILVARNKEIQKRRASEV